VWSSRLEVLHVYVFDVWMQAAVTGDTCQSAEWSSKLDDSFGSCVSEVIELAETLPCHSEVQMLEKCIAVMSEDSQKPVVFLEIATVLSREGIAALSTKDFLPALRALRDCYRPVEEIRRLTRQAGDLYREACVVENDVAFHMATASALQAIRAGKPVTYVCITVTANCYLPDLVANEMMTPCMLLLAD